MTEETNFQKILKICSSMGVKVGEYDEEGIFIRESESTMEPEMPKDLDSVPVGDLGNVMNQQHEWASFLTARLSEFRTNLDTIESAIKDLEAVELVKESEEKLAVKKAKTRLSEEYRTWHQHREVTKGVCIILESAIQKANNRYATISRYISLRQQDFDRTVRGSSYTQKPFNKETVATTEKAGSFNPGRAKRFTQ